MNLIINSMHTGMIPTKKTTLHIPISVNEITEDVYVPFEIGINMVHLHARDYRTEEPTYNGEIYRDIEKLANFP